MELSYLVDLIIEDKLLTNQSEVLQKFVLFRALTVKLYHIIENHVFKAGFLSLC